MLVTSRPAREPHLGQRPVRVVMWDDLPHENRLLPDMIAAAQRLFFGNIFHGITMAVFRHDDSSPEVSHGGT